MHTFYNNTLSGYSVAFTDTTEIPEIYVRIITKFGVRGIVKDNVYVTKSLEGVYSVYLGAMNMGVEKIEVRKLA